VVLVLVLPVLSVLVVPVLVRLADDAPACLLGD
jgi:hypothetical protein